MTSEWMELSKIRTQISNRCRAPSSSASAISSCWNAQPGPRYRGPTTSFHLNFPKHRAPTRLAIVPPSPRTPKSSIPSFRTKSSTHIDLSPRAACMILTFEGKQSEKSGAGARICRGTILRVWQANNAKDAPGLIPKLLQLNYHGGLHLMGEQ